MEIKLTAFLALPQRMAQVAFFLIFFNHFERLRKFSERKFRTLPHRALGWLAQLYEVRRVFVGHVDANSLNEGARNRS
jgi:hypothetical protein